MAEQSLRERMHPSVSASAAENRGAKIGLLLGGIVGLAGAGFLAPTYGYLWAVPGLIVAAGCAWLLLARPKHA